MFKVISITALLLFSIVSSALSPPASGHHDGVPVFLGVWSQTRSSNRIIDTSLTSGNLTINLNVTNAHRGSIAGINGFDVTVTYNPALLRAIAAGLSASSVQAALPSGAALEPICPAAEGCVFDLPGRRILAIRVELDLTIDAGGTRSTPGRSRVIVVVNGTNAAPNGVMLRFRFEVRALESLVLDTNANGAHNTGEPVIAGAEPLASAATKDDSKIKHVDTNANLLWDTGEPVAYDTNANGVFETGEPIIAGMRPAIAAVLRDDSRIRYVDTNSNDIWNSNIPSDSSDIRIDETTTVLTTGQNQQIQFMRYLKIDGFFSNSPTSSDYKVSISPVTATVMPTQTATPTVTVGSVTGTPGTVTLSSRVVSPVTGAEFPTADPTVTVVFSQPAGTPPFSSTMTVSTTVNTIRRDVGVSGIHTIIVNATSLAIPRGVITTFRLTVEFPPLDFSLSTSRNTVVLRPGEDSPEVRFIDGDGDGIYDFGETLVLDANLNGFVGTGDWVVSVTPARPATPQVRFMDSDSDLVYTPAVDLSGDKLVFDANLNGVVDLGDTIVSVSPVAAPSLADNNKSLLEISGRLSFIDGNGNNVYDQVSPGGTAERIVLDFNENGKIDSSDKIVTETPARAPNAAELGLVLKGELDKPLFKLGELGSELLLDGIPHAADLGSDPRIKFIDNVVANSAYDFGEKVVLDADNSNLVSTGDKIVNEAPPRAPTMSEIGQALLTNAKLRVIDRNINGKWDTVEPVVHDQNGSGTYTAGEPVIIGDTPVAQSPLREDSRFKYVDIDADTVWDTFEPVVYDTNESGVYDTGEPVLSGANPASGTSLKVEARIKYSDSNNDTSWVWSGETVAFDSQPNGMVDIADTIVSAIPMRPPLPRVKFIDGSPGSGDLNRYNVGEKIVLDVNDNAVVDASDSTVSVTPPGPPAPSDLSKPLLGVEIILTASWLSGGPERVEFIPQLIGPLDLTIGIDAGSALGLVSGPVVVGFERKNHTSTIRITTEPNSGSLAPWTRLPVLYAIRVEARGQSGVSRTTTLTLILAEEGYRYDLPFDYRLLDETSCIPFPAACALGSRTVLDKVLKDDVKLRYFDANDDTVWTSGETVAYDSNANGFYDTAEPIVAGAALTPGTVLKDDPKIRYHDLNNNSIRDPGEPVAYDSDGNGQYEAAEPAIAETPNRFTVQVKMDVTQGLPQNVTLTVVFAHSTITVTITGVSRSTTALSSFETTVQITLSTTSATPSGGYMMLSASPSGPNPTDETLGLCVLFQGDVNNDGAVNFIDLGRIGAGFLKSAGQPGFDAEADVNNDGAVNFLDLGIVGSEFLKSC